MYDALVTAHVVCALVGFGAVALSGVYGALAARQVAGRSQVAGQSQTLGEQPEETTRYFASKGLAEWLILPVPFLGAGALAMKPSKGDFGDIWIVAGIVIWVIAAAVLLVAVRPAEGRIRGGVHVARAGRRLMWSSVASDLLFVVALGLMVTQPK